MELNELISRAAPNSEVTLPSGEFEGPLVINKPLRLKGKNTTVWARKSPVIQITSSGVTLSDIRAEITEGSIEEPAITADFMTSASGVEVLGRVSGFGAEDGFFDIPRTIELGKFPAESENTFKLEVNVPAKTEIICEMREVKLSPNMLNAGRNELTITINGISAQTFLYAEVLFRSQFTRRVYITGRPDTEAQQAVLKPIYTAPERKAAPVSVPPEPAPKSMPEPIPAAAAERPPEAGRQISEAAIQTAARAIHEMMSGNTVLQSQRQKGGMDAAQASANDRERSTCRNTAAEATKTDVINMTGRQAAPPPNSALPPLDMKRGQRVGLSQYLGERFEVWFTADTHGSLEIDPYVFLLKSGDRAIGDEGLIFFGNERSSNGEVKYFPADGHIEIDLGRVSPEIEKIALAYSVYDGGAAKNFGLADSPRVSLRANGERVSFTMDELSDETTVVAVEFYLYKGEWKISAVGAGFRDGLAKLCNRYGIEVI